MAYMDCRYYKKIEDIMGEFITGIISEEEVDKKVLEALYLELAHPDENTEWLVNHYNSAAEALHEWVENIEEAERLYAVSKKETAIFERFGYEGEARRIQEWAEEGIAHWREEYAVR